MSGLPLNIDIQQVLLHMLNLVILVGGLYFLLYKPVRGFMDKRASYYADIDRQAEESKAKAAKLEGSYRTKLAAADDEAQKIRSDAEAKAEDILFKAREDAETESRRILDDAKERAIREKEMIVRSAKTEIIDLVIEAEKKLIKGDEEHAE